MHGHTNIKEIQVCSYQRHNIFRHKHVNIADDKSSTICVFNFYGYKLIFLPYFELLSYECLYDSI